MLTQAQKGKSKEKSIKYMKKRKFSWLLEKFYVTLQITNHKE